MKTKISMNQWCETYLNPVVDVCNGASEPTQAMLDGFAGFILDGILAIKDVDGEEANDWECVEMVAILCDNAMQIQDKF